MSSQPHRTKSNGISSVTANNELFAIGHRRQFNYIFGFLFGVGLLLIMAPYLLGIHGEETIPVYLQKGISIVSLTSFKIYRLLFFSSYLYALLVGILKIKKVNDREERKFLIRFMIVLMILVFQPLVPVIKTFPENMFFFATGYFFLNILFLKYVGNRLVEDFDLLPSGSLPEMFTADTQILTDREKEVLLLLELGLTNKNIGERLFISETTVKTHLKNIYHKFGVNNRTRLLHKLRNNTSSREI